MITSPKEYIKNHEKMAKQTNHQHKENVSL
jgi:hypothetical protein